MEKELLIKMVQAQIGYTFKNPNLLIQAFTRSSYAMENGGEDNEVLEFIGDKALDFAVIKLLISKYGKMKSGEAVDGRKVSSYQREWLIQKGEIKVIDNNEFTCLLDENELTKIKSRIVQRKNLAKRMDEMRFSELLIMGKGDIKNNVGNEMSVKEDAFEAIVGAVALDCGWNFEKICSVVEVMVTLDDFLKDDKDDNYVRLIQDWEEQENGVTPLFWFRDMSYETSLFFPFDGICQNYPLFTDYSKLKITCDLKLLNDLPIFRGFGSSKSEARMNVCKLAYEWLLNKGMITVYTIKDEIDNPNLNDSINQLEILSRRGYFSIPTYSFSETHDKNGNPIWNVKCEIKEFEKAFTAKSSSKKDAKKSAAFKMLKHVLK